MKLAVLSRYSLVLALAIGQLSFGLPRSPQTLLGKGPVSAAEGREHDHEAFLGPDQAKEFDKLSEEESVDRLRKLVVKIDKDGDGFVTKEELSNWIEKVQERYIMQNVVTEMKKMKGDEFEEPLTWAEFVKHTYELESEDDLEEGDPYGQKAILKIDRKRWEYADKNGDGKLSHLEFKAFLDPHGDPSMRPYVAYEALESRDTNGDGKLDLNEYVGNVSNMESDYVEYEKNLFAKHDKNNDGFLDVSEMADLTIPADNPHDGEAEHLINLADGDKDGKLTADEIVAHHEVFAGSQATDFGQILHDEF